MVEKIFRLALLLFTLLAKIDGHSIMSSIINFSAAKSSTSSKRFPFSHGLNFVYRKKIYKIIEMPLTY